MNENENPPITISQFVDRYLDDFYTGIYFGFLTGILSELGINSLVAIFFVFVALPVPLVRWIEKVLSVQIEQAALKVVALLVGASVIAIIIAIVSAILGLIF